MFIGHYAPALAAAVLPRAPRLGPLFIAAQLVDIAFFLLALAGVEHYAIQPWFTAMSPFDLYDMRWTHSLLGTLGWAAGFAIVVRLMGGGRNAAWIGAAVVASHWFLDLLVHAPDLTIAGRPERMGLGLWNHPHVAMPLELGLTAAALTLYANRTRGGRLARQRGARAAGGGDGGVSARQLAGSEATRGDRSRAGGDLADRACRLCDPDRVRVVGREHQASGMTINGLPYRVTAGTLACATGDER